MSSGFFCSGKQPRCFKFWLEYKKCYAAADFTEDYHPQVEDYNECLTHLKEVSLWNNQYCCLLFALHVQRYKKIVPSNTYEKRGLKSEIAQAKTLQENFAKKIVTTVRERKARRKRDLK
ncbi:hypothetical protein MJO29_012217 [Puccinia striiformis f. sp. tritici]|nr:hypothetical protein MJO29_012217 [Puccinia striiformis f. sp. tritici]